MGKENSKLKPKDLGDINEQTEFTEKEIKAWYKGFKQDYPHGYLTVDEFMEVYGNLYPGGDASAFAENTFRVFDHNKDGKIDFREFVIGLSMSTRGSFDDKMEWIFRLYDTNEDGYISKDEMLVVVKAIHQMCRGATEDSAAKTQVEKLFSKMDTNSDGQISMEEFLALARSDPIVSGILTGDMASYKKTQ